MSRYQITGIIYIHISMNERVKGYTWKFPHKHGVFSAPDEHMPYIIQLHIMSTQPENQAAEHLISSVIIMTSIGKENRSSQCWSHKEWAKIKTNSHFNSGFHCIDNTGNVGTRRQKQNLWLQFSTNMWSNILYFQGSAVLSLVCVSIDSYLILL